MSKVVAVVEHPAFLLALVAWFTFTGVSFAVEQNPSAWTALGAGLALVGAVLAGQRFVARRRRGR